MLFLPPSFRRHRCWFDLIFILYLNWFRVAIAKTCQNAKISNLICRVSRRLIISRDPQGRVVVVLEVPPSSISFLVLHLNIIGVKKNNLYWFLLTRSI